MALPIDPVCGMEIVDEHAAPLAQGVFVPGRTCKAWIRFSNGKSDPERPDVLGDARGMAIKLTGVKGAKLLPEESAAETQDFIMNLSFTPWHSLPEHRPLGGVNRVRRIVYEQVSKLRHDLNRAPRKEPTGDESFPR